VYATVPWAALRDFFQLPWFQRVWIVQEYVVSKDVVFVYGQQTYASTFGEFARSNHAARLMSRKTATIFGQRTIPEPSPPHIGKGVATVATVAQAAAFVYIYSPESPR
jgi:hypothetical protein